MKPEPDENVGNERLRFLISFLFLQHAVRIVLFRSTGIIGH